MKKENCPMRGACLTENILYYKISCDNKKYKPKLYKEICKTTFVNVIQIIKKSFNAEKTKSDTKLSTEHWKLTNKKLHPRISWNIN